MTLREFIEQEIRSERISCIEDFGESLDKNEIGLKENHFYFRITDIENKIFDIY